MGSFNANYNIVQIPEKAVDRKFNANYNCVQTPEKAVDGEV